jgi:2-amino-4-hydroxy-6-hydroxymethyldihydropteridine diphosphokinase
MPEAYIGLGSNLGDPAAYLGAALERLDEGPLSLLLVSDIRETEPVGYTEQPHFLNAVALVYTELRARELLDRLLEIERELGRDRTLGPRFGPRTIDLDLLLYGDEVVDEPDLTVPHPRLADRVFVLEPLAEIAPRLRLPDGRRVKDLLRAALE